MTPACLGRQRGDDLDRETITFAGTFQEIRAAAAALAEVEIVADDDAGDIEARDQHVTHEGFRVEPGKAGVEGQFDQQRHAEPLGQHRLHRRRRQAEHRLATVEEIARVRLEGQEAEGPAKRIGAGRRRRQHGAMAKVHAVEIADRQHRPGQFRGKMGGITQGMQRHEWSKIALNACLDPENAAACRQAPERAINGLATAPALRCAAVKFNHPRYASRRAQKESAPRIASERVEDEVGDGN